MPATIFYPATGTPGSTQLGPYTVGAKGDLPFAPGSFPLIVFSHGTSGSTLDDSDLEVGLAKHGYVVAAVEHAGDNYHDRSGLGSDRVLIGRSMQLSALIDAVLQSSTLAPHIDASRIGAAGFSAGGSDVLLLAGARPNFALKDRYCAAMPADKTFCGWSVRVSTPPLAAHADTRVRAVLALDPVGLYFDREALAAVDAPVDLWTAKDDTVLQPEWNAQHINELLAVAHFYHVAPGDHYVFLSPCSQQLRNAAPEVCTDGPGIDRKQVQAQVLSDATAFFGLRLAVGSYGPLRDALTCEAPFRDIEDVKAQQPEYPADAARLHLPATRVLVDVHVGADGKVIDGNVSESSGVASLDKAALGAALASEYSPKIIYCKPVEGHYSFAASFEPN